MLNLQVHKELEGQVNFSKPVILVRNDCLSELLSVGLDLLHFLLQESNPLLSCLGLRVVDLQVNDILTQLYLQLLAVLFLMFLFLNHLLQNLIVLLDPHVNFIEEWSDFLIEFLDLFVSPHITS